MVLPCKLCGKDALPESTGTTPRETCPGCKSCWNSLNAGLGKLDLIEFLPGAHREMRTRLTRSMNRLGNDRAELSRRARQQKRERGRFAA